MDVRSILMQLRQGRAPAPDALRRIANGLADGSVSDAQAGAFAMGICRTGLDEQARVALTLAMRDTGDVLQWRLDRPVLDKHSTGGIGDCVSLVLAPALVACGAAVPMISGRGLGHTGGTLDKLEAIPGLRTQFDPAKLHNIVADTGCAIVGASAQIAPADRRLYAVRDVTGTVESLDLITASILSKKLAAGLEGLVLDVKTGAGAFMKNAQDARMLAETLVRTANAAGCPTAARLTDMSQPLAPDMGNALEVASALRVLTGQDRGRLYEVTIALGADVLANSVLFADRQGAARALETAIGSGQAAACFARIVAAQGGDADILERWQDILPKAPVVQPVPAPATGYLSRWDGVALGLCVVNLGGGRQVETDRIDPRVGLASVVPLGVQVQMGDPIAFVHASDEAAAARAILAVQQAVGIDQSHPVIAPVVQDGIF